MIRKRPLVAHRVRRYLGSFAAIEHRFLRDGFWAELSHQELLLYFFLAMVADRDGLSYYSYDRICSLLAITVDEYILARDGLIDMDLLAFDGSLYQLLSLPAKPSLRVRPVLTDHEDMLRADPATIGQLIAKQFGGDHDR